MIDTNVFIHIEKSGLAIDWPRWGPDRIYVSVVTVSELLVGVHRANSEARKKLRSEFVETTLTIVGVLDFTTETARIHAELFAELARNGRMMGAHDLMIAATACQHDLSIITDNVDEFSRIPDLRVIPFRPPG